MRALNPSIRKRLLAGTILAIAFATLTGSIVVYLAQRKVLIEQLDGRLQATAELLTIEIELEDGKPYQEWLVHILDNDVRRRKDLIQVWGLQSGETYKAPALKDFELPKFHGDLNEPVIRSITLPDGKEGRALGIKVFPSYDEKETITPTSLEGLEHICVIALNTKDLRHGLRELRQTLTWVVATTIFLTALSILWVVNRSLIPIQELSQRLQQRETDRLGNPVTISDKFPRELRNLVEQYNGLLLRIEGVRVRERDFSTHAAHELRTPLAGIQATLEQAINSSKDADDYDHRITQALIISKQMAGLVTHLMRFSRLQSGTHRILVEEINLHEVIEATWRGLSEKCQPRGLAAEWQLDSASFLHKTDEDLVRILFTNLLDNAICHAKDNSNIHLETSDQDGQFIFTISNLSATPLPADLDRLFEPFYRVDKARTGDDNHTGIGLSLSREIAKNLNIKIKVSTTEIREFQVTLVVGTPR
ncbi:MAG: signal transduction histidine kinase [Akkermansiaceae bacterium]|jgi:signal transduction histidine kinase